MRHPGRALRRFAAGRDGSAAVDYALLAAAVAVVGLGVVGAIGSRSDSLLARLERGFGGGLAATRIETVPARPAPPIPTGAPVTDDAVAGLGLKR